jgi:hypothetical protein
MGTGVLQYPGEFGRKMGLSGYCMTLDLWGNSFYSSYTLMPYLRVNVVA